MNAPLRFAALGVVIAYSTGCYSSTTLGRAHTVGAKHVEIFGAAEALLVPGSGHGVLTRPVGQVGVRYGVTDRVDLEGRITTFGGNLATRIQLRRGAPRFGIDAMLTPGIAFTAPDKLAFELPVVLGLNLPHDNQLVLAPRLVHQLRFTSGLPRPVHFLFVGLSTGFAWRIAPHVSLFPEVALLTQAFAETGFSSNVSGTVSVQAAAGILLDF